MFCSPQTSPVSVLRPLYRPVPINTQQTLLKNIAFSEHCLAVNTTIFKMKHKQIYSLQNMISYVHTSGSTTFTSAQCVFCSAYFPRNRTSSAHLTYICPSLFECAGNTFFHIFVILKILNLSKTLRTPNLYYVIYGRPLMVV